MKPEQFKESFKRYIETILVPRYPEIEYVDVEISKGRGWSFVNKTWQPIIRITFFVDGIEDSVEKAIKNDLESMKSMFSLNDEVAVRWRFISDDTLWNGDWYV